MTEYDYDGEYNVTVRYYKVKARSHDEAKEKVSETLGNSYLRDVISVEEINEKMGGNPNEMD
jgi:hypothetical protein